MPADAGCECLVASTVTGRAFGISRIDEAERRPPRMQPRSHATACPAFRHHHRLRQPTREPARCASHGVAASRGQAPLNKQDEGTRWATHFTNRRPPGLRRCSQSSTHALRGAREIGSEVDAEAGRAPKARRGRSSSGADDGENACPSPTVAFLPHRRAATPWPTMASYRPLAPRRPIAAGSAAASAGTPERAAQRAEHHLSR